MMTFGKVSTPIPHSSPLCSKYLSPLHQLFKRALKKLNALHLFMKKFQPLVLMKLQLKKPKENSLLLLKWNQKFLSLRNLKLRFQKW